MDSPPPGYYEPGYRKPCKQCAVEDGVNLFHCELCDGEGCLTCNFTGRMENEDFDWSDYALCKGHIQAARDAAHAERED